MALTDTALRAVRPGDKPQKLFDGNGLFLLVSPSGTKAWRFKYRFHGREKLISLG
ncbi:MAG: Arm DNA-binding domain-containing protein, partial [Desulfovibrio sp.]|nr:Arm DNA-binding domain-containing protein [Desulfovibrio sp.]